MSIAGFIPPVFNRHMQMKPVVQAARAVKIAKALKSGKLEVFQKIWKAARKNLEVSGLIV